jgi:hypothetical protein
MAGDEVVHPIAETARDYRAQHSESCPHSAEVFENPKYRLRPHVKAIILPARAGFNPDYRVDAIELWILRSHLAADARVETREMKGSAPTLPLKDKLHAPGTKPARAIK